MNKILTKANYDRLVDKFLKTTPRRLAEIERMKKVAAASKAEGKIIRAEKG